MLEVPASVNLKQSDHQYSAIRGRVEKTRARTANRSPNTVAFVERFVQTIKKECINHFIVFGEKQMSLLCTEFSEHYQLGRPHQGLENERPTHTRTKKSAKLPDPVGTIRGSDIRCKERLGGLLKSYSRKAA